jgi:hypothetical protein
MKKPVEMSLETARQMYKENNEITNKWLLENFTKEELEPKRGFTWEESFKGRGVCINGSAKVCGVENYSNNPHNKHVFLTDKHAKSTLAFAQLSHIVERYNQGKTRHSVIYTIDNNRGNLTKNSYVDCKSHFEFHTQEDRDISMEVNRQLWLDYWMID